MQTTARSATRNAGDSKAPKIKTLDIRLALPDDDIERKIKHAFDLAKSAGRELNLILVPTQGAPASVRANTPVTGP